MSNIQNKKCGKCEKIVYPAEEIKYLDKVKSSIIIKNKQMFYFLCRQDLK